MRHSKTNMIFSFIRYNKFNGILFFKPFLLLALALLFWQIFSGFILPRFNPAASNILPTPFSVILIGWHLFKRGELLVHILASLRRVLIGFFLSALLGIFLGIWMGISRKIKSQFNTLIELLRMVPPYAWIPLILLWFGIGDKGVIFLIVITSIFPIIINTVNGIESVKIVFIQAAQSLGCQRKQELFFRVVLPVAISRIFLGLRIGLSFSWRALVGAEIIGSISGIGYLIRDSGNLGLPNLVVLGMLIIAAIGYILDFGIRVAGHYFLVWVES